MTVTILCFLHRTPGTTMEHFISYYEHKHMHVIYEVTGRDAFPLQHKRHYIHRTAPSGGTSTAVIPGLSSTVAPPTHANRDTPATLYKGEQAQVDFDCISEITFADDEHFARFFTACMSPEGQARLSEDQEHFQVMDRHFVVLQGEARTTTLESFK